MIAEPGRLVGRREELALIDAALREAEGGEPRFVVLGGDAGIGKTRLMEHVAARPGRPGTRVLRGGCVELGAEGLPLAPVTAMLRDLDADDPGALPPGAAALRRLLPGADTGAEPEPEPEPSGRARLFELFAELVERLGRERPVLLVVDDLHWADRSTRDLLGFLARRLRGTRVLTLMAFRADALGRRHPLRAFVADLERLPAVRRIDLAPFDRAETAELLTAVRGGARPPEALVDRVYRASGGNPLFAGELAGTGGAELPDTLRDLLLQKFEELPGTVRDVVRLASAGGPRVSHGLLAEVAGLAADDLLAALRAATDAQMLVVAGDGYAFRHNLLYEAVAADLLPAERARLHRMYAEALEARPDLAFPGRAVAETAFHWHEAGDAERALPALLRAADAAEAIHAQAEQCQMLVRALDLWPRGEGPGDADRYGVLEKAMAAAGWSGESLLVLDLADRELVDETDPGRTAMLLAHRGLALHNLGRDGAATAVEEALTALAGAAPLARARALDLVGAVFMLRGRPERARDAATEAMRVAAELGEMDLAANASTTASTVLAQLGRYGDALEALDEAGGLPGRRRDVVRLARVHLNRAEVLGALGRHDDAAGAARLGLDAARAAGLARTLGALLALRLAASLAAAGRWDEAVAAIADALALDPPGGTGSMLHALHGEIALARGDLDIARERLALARTLTGPESGWEGVPAARLEAGIALRDDRVADARSAVAEALRAPASTPAQTWPVLALGARIETQARLRGGTPGGAGEPLTPTLREHAASLAPEGLLGAAYAAELAAELGGADASWAAAVDAWDAVGDPFAASCARLRAAQEAAGAGDRDAAAALLRVVADEAGRLGARPLGEEAGLVARAAHVGLGAGPGPEAGAVERLGLTAREAEVLRLITAGRSNRQIAEELFISPKTASVHVSRILGKLGAATRGEAAATAHRLRLFQT